jgi:Nucleotidyl transferase AbiEii toxin, Type IV TA system
MDKVAQLSARERKELFTETAAAMTTTPAIAEKDFWVVWALHRLFGHERLKGMLQFKGGTSLSKVFDLIGRFSEDIDLILDWRQVAIGDPHAQRSKTQQALFNEATNTQAKTYIRDTMLPMVAGALAPSCQCRIDEDNAFAISVRYPAAFSDKALRPEILLEIGPLAAWSPSAVFPISSYAAQHFPAVFAQAQCHVPTILAKRTFWEKATILHQEAHRDASKPMPPRYSRHYYDLALLAQSTVRQEALADAALLAEVVAFKQRFYPAAWAQYGLAQSGTFKLMPPVKRMRDIEQDFNAMQNMIFDKRLSLQDIMATLSQLEQEINRIEP